MVARDLELVAWTGARYHVAHASAARTVDLVRDAKRRGLPVTCEVTPHHVALTDEACAGYDPDTKVMPPLRSGADPGRLIDALADGTVDAIATDHAPHSSVEKALEFECAAPGMLGLETAVPLVLALVRRGALPLARAVELLTSGPARTFGLAGGGLAVGAAADVCVIDPARAGRSRRTSWRRSPRTRPSRAPRWRAARSSPWSGDGSRYDLDGRAA